MRYGQEGRVVDGGGGGLNMLHYWFASMIYNLYPLDYEWNQNEDNTCEDIEAWCTFMSEFECNKDQVRGKCQKACRQCNGK